MSSSLTSDKSATAILSNSFANVNSKLEGFFWVTPVSPPRTSTGFSSSLATTVTFEANVYLLVLPVDFAVKLTLIAAGLFSSVATKPRTVTTVPVLLFFFPVKFFDFDG